MRSWRLIFLVVLFPFSLLGQVRVDEPVKDLGEVFEKRGHVKTVFTLNNPSFTDTLRIVDVETSCGCTAILTNDTLIFPRSSTDLDVSYDPEGRLGLFVKSVAVTVGKNSAETSKLFLKIMGNVVAENYSTQDVNKALVEYKVAPIYFYPLSPYDTAYFDLGYVSTFINDLSYEIDFYQFTTVGVEVEVRGYEQIEALENLIQFSQKRLEQGFLRRGFSAKTVFFNEPVFKISKELPAWAAASIRLYSVNFDEKEALESKVKVTSDEVIQENKLLLDYTRFGLPKHEEVAAELNLEAIEGKLFLNGELDLQGIILMPWKKSEKLKKKYAKQLTKEIYKELSSTTGAGKKAIRISFDSLGVHPSDKYYFALWDKSDEQRTEEVKYQVKSEQITPPLLPTYKQLYTEKATIDTANHLFKQFFASCLASLSFTDTLHLLLVSNYDKSFSDAPQKLRTNAQRVKEQLLRLFEVQTNKVVAIEVKHLLRGDSKQLTTQNNSFNYFTIVPLTNLRKDIVVPHPKPYMVNFDYYFKGIDTKAWGFKQFAEYINAAVVTNGFVELRIESSISEIPIEEAEPNTTLAYNRLIESEKRLLETMTKKLIDPNRILFTDELVVKQGPAYDGTIPVLHYRKFHYIRIVAEESLK